MATWMSQEVRIKRLGSVGEITPRITPFTMGLVNPMGLVISPLKNQKLSF